MLRRINTDALMRFALENGEFTASEAMRATGLTRATILGLCADLVTAGWLEKGSTAHPASPSRGRPALRYRLRSRIRVIGLDAAVNHFTAEVADLAGTRLARRRVIVDSAELGRDGRIRRAEELIAEVLAEAGSERAEVALVVVGIPAPVDGQGRSPDGPNDFWPLMNADFMHRLEGRVIVENDANLAALGSVGAGLAGADPSGPTANAATLLTGARFGAGLVVDGRLLHGAWGGAGEMRLLDALFDDPSGTDGIALLARRWASAELAAGSAPSLLRDLPEVTAEAVAEAAGSGDELAISIIDRIAWRVARIALALGSLLDVTTVTLAGSPAELLVPVVARARDLAASNFYPPFPDLAASELGRDVVVRGAVLHALARLREDPHILMP